LEIDQILKDVAFKRTVETPLTVMALEPTKVGESSEPNCSEPMDVELPTAEDSLVAEEKEEEAQHKPTTIKDPKSREKCPTNDQAAVDTPIAIGFVSGRTSETISWSFGEPLSRLGDNWLGNPFIALASLIPAPSLVDDNSLPPKETMENMLFHLLFHRYLFFQKIIFILFSCSVS
jgi:hypothetical protein